MRIPATAAILAGGASSRFGSDKALAPWDGGRVIDAVAGPLAALFESVLVIAKEPARYGSLRSARVEPVRDRGEARHPLVGLSTALEEARTEFVFVCGCDMPLLKAGLIRKLWEERRGCAAVAPLWAGRVQPLCAFYSKGCAGAVRALLESGLAPRELFERVPARLLSEEEVRREDPEGLSFVDLDTPADHEAARRLHA